MKRIVGGAAILALLLAGCGSGETPAAQTVTAVATVTAEAPAPKEATAKTVTVTATVTVTESVEAPQTSAARPMADMSRGTRDNPLAAGSTTTLSADWTVRLGKTNLDAWSEIDNGSGVFDPPADGSVAVLVPIEATYSGENSAHPGMDLQVELVGADGKVYNSSGGGSVADGCMAPDDLLSANEVYAGATASGGECVKVPTEQLDGAVWRVEESISFDDREPAFFALK